MVFAFSPIKTRQYAVGTFLGMLPVSFVIVNLGQSLSTVNAMNELFTTEVILSFILIGVLALATSMTMRHRNRNIKSNNTAELE
jgi:uncharacterized membrane protein YdjX (TVP38/TMEM64 family)